MFFILILIAIILFFGVLILFSFPQLSPIPYFPSNPEDMSLIIQALRLGHDQVIVDLGAGDGIVIFKAAQLAFEKKLNTQFVAIEVNPILCAIMYVRRLFHPNKKAIHIVMKDLFKTNYKKLLSTLLIDNKYSVTIYLYISHWLIKHAIEQVDKSLDTYDVVSYFYPVPFLKEKNHWKGKNNLYRY